MADIVLGMAEHKVVKKEAGKVKDPVRYVYDIVVNSINKEGEK